MILTLLTRERKIPVVPAGTMGSSRQLHLLLVLETLTASPVIRCGSTPLMPPFRLRDSPGARFGVTPAASGTLGCMALSGLSSAVSAAGVLISRADGRTLLVQTHHRRGLVLPGGMVEEGESPARAAEREVREELGLEVRVTRLLAVQHKPADDHTPERFLFDFDCPRLAATPLLRLQAEEIAEAVWLPEDEAVERHVETGRARLRAAFAARRNGSTAYVDGERVLT
jgi:8-oxo-dGTP diphosphatase